MWESVAALLTIERGVYDVGCIVIEDRFHRLYLEQRRGQSKRIKQDMNENKSTDPGWCGSVD